MLINIIAMFLIKSLFYLGEKKKKPLSVLVGFGEEPKKHTHVFMLQSLPRISYTQSLKSTFSFLT